MSLRIEDYGLIGDTHTAALVGAHGSVDWLCLPRFDSPACFAALLGTDDNGFWSVAPAEQGFESTRRYRGPSLVLETEFRTSHGAGARGRLHARSGAISLDSYASWRASAARCRCGHASSRGSTMGGRGLG